MSDPNKNFSKNQSLSEVSKKVAYEKLTRSLLRKIRENDAADKKEHHVPKTSGVVKDVSAAARLDGMNQHANAHDDGHNVANQSQPGEDEKVGRVVIALAAT
jgi:hypothetical protein